MISQHMLNEFHRIQVYRFLAFLTPLTCLQEWTGTFFQKSSLRNIGHRVQLGRQPGEICTSPQWSTRPFTMIHTNGIHLLNVCFCGCDLTIHHGDCVQQLLQHHLFPTTTTDL